MPIVTYDVFLSYSSSDEKVVTQLAEQLRRDGLRVWFDKWEILPGDPIGVKIQEGLAKSRILLLGMSNSAFRSDWSVLESQTFLFRDPLNHERRFIPLLLEQAEIPDTIRQFRYVDWRTRSASEYASLLARCKPPEERKPELGQRHVDTGGHLLNRAVLDLSLYTVDAHLVLLVALSDGDLLLIERESRRIAANLSRQSGRVSSVAVTPDGQAAVTGAADGMVRFWSLAARWMRGHTRRHTQAVNAVAIRPDGLVAASGSSDGWAFLWDVSTEKAIGSIQFDGVVNAISFLPDGNLLVGGSDTRNRLVVWRPNVDPSVVRLPGHSGSVSSIAVSLSGRRAVSGSWDRTVRIWDIEALAPVGTLEGHTGEILRVAISGDGGVAASGGSDSNVRLWDLRSGQCTGTIAGHTGAVSALGITTDGRTLFSGALDGLYVSNLSVPVASAGAIQTPVYTNAKVILAGRSCAGKTGLAIRLTTGTFQPSDSTSGAWATQLKLLGSETPDGRDREIWLWDFAGQLDYTLVHQLFMDEAALSILVFDPQADDPLPDLKRWDGDLTRAARRSFNKLLVAGRCDVAGLRSSRAAIEAFARERGFARFMETSAKTGMGCDELLQAIRGNIAWNEMPYTSSPRLFRTLKQRILELRDEGRVLMRREELKQQIEMRLPDVTFSYSELHSAVALLAGPGLIWELEFGDFILLQPEKVEAYAGALFRSLRSQRHDLGSIDEDSFVNGQLRYDGMRRLDGTEEQIVLQALYQMLLRRGLCLREMTDNGALLVFPSFFRGERPDMLEHPPDFITYRISGPLEEIYATLVVRLHHTKAFEKDQLWRFAADFLTQEGKRLGVKMKLNESGAQGELTIYVDPSIPEDTRLTFAQYVHDHVSRKAETIKRMRHYTCPRCLEAISLATSQKGLRLDLKEINCSLCSSPIPLFDHVEAKFGSVEINTRTQHLILQSKSKIEDQERMQLVVGDLMAIATKAGHVYRHLSNAAMGVDDEIEFRDSSGELSGRRIYLQLDLNAHYELVPVANAPSLDDPAAQIRYATQLMELGLETSDLSAASRGDILVLRVRSERMAAGWKDLRYPLMLIVRGTNDSIRWMDIRSTLRAGSGRNQKYIAFRGQPVMLFSLQEYRNQLIASNAA